MCQVSVVIKITAHRRSACCWQAGQASVYGRVQECFAVLLMCYFCILAACTFRTRQGGKPLTGLGGVDQTLTPAIPRVATPTSLRRLLCLSREDFLCNQEESRGGGVTAGFAFPS